LGILCYKSLEPDCTLSLKDKNLIAFHFIAIFKKTFRLRKVFLLQPLMPPSFYAERIYDKRYNRRYRLDPAARGPSARSTGELV
jgi:hypothetical protein